MSSLMQFRGETKGNKVGLQFILIKKVGEFSRTEDVDTYKCTVCGQRHARIAVAFRRPVRMWGQWVVFRYLGDEHVPDLSIPISVEKYPRGAEVLNDEESSKLWHV